MSCLTYFYLTRFPTEKSEFQTRFETCSRYSHTGGSRAGVIRSPPLCPRCAPWSHAAGWGSPSHPSPPWRPLALGVCNHSGGPLVSVRLLSGSCTPCTRWDPPFRSGSLSRRGVPCCSVWGSPVCRHCAPWAHAPGWGSPSPFSPSGVACIRRARSFRGAPLLRLSAVGLPRRARMPGVFVPFLFPGHGPMAALTCCRPCAGLASRQRLQRHLVLLMVQVLAVFSCIIVCVIKVFGQVPCAAGSCRRLHCLVRRLFPAASRHAAPLLPSVPCPRVAQAVGGFSSPPPRPRPSSPCR